LTGSVNRGDAGGDLVAFTVGYPQETLCRSEISHEPSSAGIARGRWAFRLHIGDGTGGRSGLDGHPLVERPFGPDLRPLPLATVDGE
jgi:hypothetical protein